MAGVASARQTTAVAVSGPIDFFERQRLNRRRSLLLVALFAAALTAFGLALDYLWLGVEHDGRLLPIATCTSLVVAAAMSIFSYYRGANLVMASLLAQPINVDDSEQRQLHNIVSEMALAAGLPMPTIFIIPDPAPNALAAGRDPQHAVLGVTEGLLLLLDREETQGVIAHEMAHIGNRDTLTMTLVGILFGAAMMLADWARRTASLSSDRRRGNVLLFGVVLVAIVLTPLLSQILAMAVSRQREYLADATAVQLTRNPLGLARALERIGSERSPLRAATRGTAHLFISNPWPRRIESKPGRFADLLSSHPPISRRIALLKAMAHGV